MADTVIDLTGGTTSDTLTDGTIFAAAPQGDAGTGNYDTFLVLGAQGTESGFNTDGTPLPLNDGQQEHTNALLLSSMQVVTVDGHDYYVFKLDANEPNSANGALLSLNTLQIYSASDPNITSLPTLQGQQLLYDMDGNATDGDVTVDLNAGKDAPAGSGQGDLFVYIPTSFFANATGDYVYLYSTFGTPNQSDGGFEEWGVITKASVDHAPTVAIEKTVDPLSIDEGEATTVTYTYKVTNTSADGAADPLTLTSLIDDNATPNDTSDDINLLNTSHTGDSNNNGLLDFGETWVFTADVNIAAQNAGGSIVNTVVVHAHDDDSTNDVSASDTATVTVKDVAPSIAIDKTVDPIEINEGEAKTVTYTYKVTNTSAAGAFDPLTLTSLIDDNATPNDTSDDINLLNTSHTGDSNNDGLLDFGETWVFTAAVNIAAHNAGSITNTVVVNANDDEGTGAPPASDDATVTVKDVAPSIAIDKTVDADHDGIFHSSETVQSGAQNATYHYAITNTSPAGALDPLTLTSLVDDNGTPANTGDDIDLLNGFVANSSHGTHYVSGDTNGDYLVDSNETWVFEATSAFNLLPKADSRTNTVEVAAHDDDSLNEVTAQDTATVSSFAGPGVRTPGFWSNLGKSFWDGVAGADKSGPNFASGELRYAVDSNNDTHKDGLDKAGLLIGDYDKDGLTTGNEDTFFISYADALKVIDASSKDLQDTRFVLARDAVATWLNFLAGNPIGDASTDPNSPQKYLDQAIDWLQVTNGGTSSTHFEDWGGGSAVKASSAAWNVGLDAESATGGNELAGNLIHQELDFYNNTGMTFEGAILHIYANDGG
ncbi:hypothetical protein [Mesorhizobium sp.]|uniref:hypothetical protein n=1 Tax=Mesorhizobium sp. TaxID=1871066 RepID=UPI000FE8F36B|nr:hypothetical protein [Mesorhizobium sp.]RWC51840.1 MAG: hypothetical protein EOS29_31895 [Mesorhizobium sp.]RWC53565.1 MAG: hypothetical protein EOS56_30415 [Mesorhizobium sp.]